MRVIKGIVLTTLALWILLQAGFYLGSVTGSSKTTVSTISTTSATK